MKKIAFFSLGVLCTLGIVSSGNMIFSSFVKLAEAEEAVHEIQLQSASPNSNSPGCLDNYTSWNSSNTFKADADWSTALFDSEYNILKTGGGNSNLGDLLRQDINGDGLVDFVLVSHQERYLTQDCVMLNNGHGWDIVYRCFSPDGITFYGDCAE